MKKEGKSIDTPDFEELVLVFTGCGAEHTKFI